MRISDWSSDVCLPISFYVFRERVGEGAYSIKRIARPVALELATDIESPHAKRRIFSPTLLRIIIESEKLEGIGMGNAFFAMISGNQRGALGAESEADRTSVV